MAPAALLAIGLLGALAIPAVAAEEQAKAVGASAECVLMINVARNAKLDVFMQPVLLDMELENKAVESLTKMAIKSPAAARTNKEECENLSQPTQANPGILLPFLKADTRASGDEAFDCADLINTLVNSGITQFKDYDNNAYTYEQGGFFYPFLSFPPLFNGKSLTFGCARTTGCKVKEEAKSTEVEKNYLYCMFQPPIEVEKAPFTKEYFQALQARKEANVDLKSLKVSDVRMSGSSAATLAVPAAVASMVAFLLI